MNFFRQAKLIGVLLPPALYQIATCATPFGKVKCKPSVQQAARHNAAALENKLSFAAQQECADFEQRPRPETFLVRFA